ncbi:MAG: DUF1501 domain-containing protein [Pyrinomonadaceae bacterium]|nr:DUF1501 domain-containing protein [Pyrinomonadaceae bacterium]
MKKSCRALSMTAIAMQMRHFGLMDVLARERMEAEKGSGIGDGSGYKALVCVFLDGGNDGNNSVVPNYDAGYNQYSAARSAQGLAIARNSLLPITPASMGGQIYGFHPAMAPLHPLWNQGKMAVVCNVGCLVQPLTRATYQAGAPRPYQLFSHPDQADQFRTGISSFKSTTGWGGRIADRTAALNTNPAIPMVTAIPSASIFTTGFNTKPLIVASAPTPLNQLLTLNGFGTAADELARRAAMNNARQQDLNQTIVQNASLITQQAVNVSQQLNTDPTLTVTFPSTTLGNQLRQVAKLIKIRTLLNMNRQIFYVSLGGFDHHSSQISPHNSLLTQVCNALKAFYDETVAQGVAAQVTTCTMSDFSRTFGPAGSGSNVGSDHGWGGPYFVIGDSVLGGNFYGRPTSNGTFWPTLVTGTGDDTDIRGRFIPSVSVEQYAGTLARWYGLAEADLPLAFPNYNNFSNSNLGFMA